MWRNSSSSLAPAPGTSGNPGKNVTICAPSPGPPEILEKTTQSEPHPRDPRKSWKKPHNITHLLGCCWLLVVGSDKLCRGPLRGQKPHNLCPIPGTRENPGKNLTILRICLLLVVVVGCCCCCADKLCRGPLRGQTIHGHMKYLLLD